MRGVTGMMAAVGLVTLVADPAVAGVYSDDLGRCFVDSTSSDDRIELIRWMAFGFSSHPDLRPTVSVDEGARASTDRYVGELFTSLLVERCRAEAVEAVRYEGPLAIQASFQVLGQVASGDLMTNPEVQGSMMGFMGHADNAAIQSLLAP